MDKGLGRWLEPVNHVKGVLAPTLIGVLVAAGLLGLGVSAMLVLVWVDSSSGGGILTALDSSRLVFSLKSAGIQGALSVVFSLLLAIPAAIALARRNYWRGITSLTMVIGLAMVMPTTVAAQGLLGVWGRSGIVVELCGEACRGFNLYGLHGVVLAHMMLNVPLMMRVFLPMLRAIPSSQWRLSAILGLSPWQRFRHIELPALMPAVGGISALVFLLCFTSFALVLMLGGGPKVTTLEVEIYSAIKFDFDLPLAAILSLIQFACAAVVVAILALASPPIAPDQVESKNQFIWRKDLKNIDKFFDGMMIFILLILIALPMMMVAVDGVNAGLLSLLKRSQFWSALMVSLSIANISAISVTILAFLMAQARVNLVVPHRMAVFNRVIRGGMKILLDGGVMLYVVIPSIVLGTASFIAFRHYGDGLGYAFGVVVMANILMALPFAVRLLDRRMATLAHRHDKLAAMLGVQGMARMKSLTLPVLKHDLGVIMGLTAALSVGDLGVIALFAHDGFKTLPWMLYQLASRYMTDEAAALALVLMVLTVAMFIAGWALVQSCLKLRT